MFYLFLSVLCSVLVGFIFKLFVRYEVDNFQAIVFNYFTCFLCGWVHLGHFPLNTASFYTPWMPYALLLGLVFITGFNAAAYTVRYFGVTVSQIMQRMSILLTVPFALIVYGESSDWLKIVGLVIALGAIILVNLPAEKTEVPVADESKSKFLLWIPLFTWLLAGALEVLFVRIKYENLADMSDPTFIITIFGTAGILGLSVAVWRWVRRRAVFSTRHVMGGIILGIPNYFSMLFALLALDSGLEGSFLFPITNIGIIMISTVGAVVLFHERLSRWNWIGISLAVIAICLISF